MCAKLMYLVLVSPRLAVINKFIWFTKLWITIIYVAATTMQLCASVAFHFLVTGHVIQDEAFPVDYVDWCCHCVLPGQRCNIGIDSMFILRYIIFNMYMYLLRDLILFKWM